MGAPSEHLAEAAMDPLLKKLMFKGQSPVLILRAPEELRGVAAKFGQAADSTVKKGPYAFALAFAKSLADADEIGKTARDALEEAAVFWMAYPKGTSKKYKGAD